MRIPAMPRNSNPTLLQFPLSFLAFTNTCQALHSVGRARALRTSTSTSQLRYAQDVNFTIVTNDDSMPLKLLPHQT
jgi:hypothetical protein